MRRLRALFLRLVELFRRAPRERELADEMESHLQLHIEDNMRRGMSPAEARREAIMKLGGVEQTKENYRERRGLPHAGNDISRLPLRPPFASQESRVHSCRCLTLALGIGGNTAVFSVMNSVLLRNLPLPHPEQLMFLRLPNDQPPGASNTGDGDTSFSDPVFEQLRKERAVFSDLMAYVPLAIGKVAVRIGEDPEEAEADMVSGNFFSGLGAAFARGRGFTLEDETAHAPLAVLSYSYWTGRFARNPSSSRPDDLCQRIAIHDYWRNCARFLWHRARHLDRLLDPLAESSRTECVGHAGVGEHGLRHAHVVVSAIDRPPPPHVTAPQALANLGPVFQPAALIGLGTPDPKNPKPVLELPPAKGIQGLRDQYAQPIAILMAMVGLVLLIACANVAMLLVARNSARQREFSMRVALGAGPGRLLRQLLAESLLLVTAGAGLGWVFAISASRALAAWSSLEVPFSLDSNVLLFTLAISFACAVVFGLAPLGSAVSVQAGTVVKSSNAAAQRTKKSSWAGKFVVAVQMALCLILLVGAGLLVRSLRNYETLPLGLRTDGLLVFGTSPLATHSDDERARFYQNLLDRLRVVPGVESAPSEQPPRLGLERQQRLRHRWCRSHGRLCGSACARTTSAPIISIRWGFQFSRPRYPGLRQP